MAAIERILTEWVPGPLNLEPGQAVNMATTCGIVQALLSGGCMSSGQPDDGASLLSFGVVVGGQSPENELVGEALRGIAKRVAELRRNHPNSGLRMNFVFHLPGPIVQPDYDGVHARKLDQRAGEILIHAAVPADLTFAEVAVYVGDVLAKARSEAGSYVRKRKVDLPTAPLDALIQEVTDELGQAASADRRRRKET